MQPKLVFLMVHGFGGSARWWDQQKSCFEKYGRVVTVDLPGHGASSWQGETLEAMADKALAQMALARDDKVVGIASSFGGLVMLKAWQKHPGVFSRLVLAGALPRFIDDLDFPAGLTLAKMDKLSLQLKGNRVLVMEMFFRSLFASQERSLPHHAQVKALYQGTPVPAQEALDAFLRMLAAEDLRDVFSRLTVPTQFIVGDADPICPLAIKVPMERLLPLLRVDVIKGCGHFPFLTRPEVFNHLVEGFMGACH